MEVGYTSKISEVYEVFRSSYTDFHPNHIDERAAYHIQTACLVLAAYRVLTEQINLDPEKSVEIINKVSSCCSLLSCLHLSPQTDCVALCFSAWETLIPGVRGSYRRLS